MTLPHYVNLQLYTRKAEWSHKIGFCCLQGVSDIVRYVAGTIRDGPLLRRIDFEAGRCSVGDTSFANVWEHYLASDPFTYLRTWSFDEYVPLKGIFKTQKHPRDFSIGLYISVFSVMMNLNCLVKQTAY